MAKFRVQQYEVHIATYEIEAKNAADAIGKIYDGQGELIETEYVETDETRGMPVGNLSSKEARELDAHDFVSTIASVTEL